MITLCKLCGERKDIIEMQDYNFDNIDETIFICMTCEKELAKQIKREEYY